MMQERDAVETIEKVAEESNPGVETVSEPAAMVSPLDNPAARAQQPHPLEDPEPVIEQTDNDATPSTEMQEELSRLRQMATQLAHDAARVLLDAADGEGGFRGGDIKRRELMKLSSSVTEYLREHERRTKRRIFEDEEDRQVLKLD